MAGNKLIEKKIDELMGVEKNPPQKPHRRLMMWLTAACALILIIVGAALVMIPQPAASEPQGKITAPKNITETARKIQITGYTKNLPPDRPYVLIAVDVKRLRLSWPKKPFIEPNSQFQMAFYEGGPPGTCCVSLYAVNRHHYEMITEWLNAEQLSDIPLLPDRYRLDSIVLKINHA